MTKRASLDTEQFKVTLPPPQRDPLDSLIPTSAPKAESRSQMLYVNPVSIEAKNERTTIRTNEQRNERSNGQKNEAVLERLVIRHTFDIFEDQLVDLKRLQIEAMQQRRRKRKLGQMVQLALDQYIKKMKDKYSLQG
jgi:hypothetical protein